MGNASQMPISGLVVTFESSVVEHSATLDELRNIPEIELGTCDGSKLAIVIDSDSKVRDQEIYNTVRELPGVTHVAVAMIAFDEDEPE